MNFKKKFYVFSVNSWVLRYFIIVCILWVSFVYTLVHTLAKHTSEYAYFTQFILLNCCCYRFGAVFFSRIYCSSFSFSLSRCCFAEEFVCFLGMACMYVNKLGCLCNVFECMWDNKTQQKTKTKNIFTKRHPNYSSSSKDDDSKRHVSNGTLLIVKNAEFSNLAATKMYYKNLDLNNFLLKIWEKPRKKNSF